MQDEEANGMAWHNASNPLELVIVGVVPCLIGNLAGIDTDAGIEPEGKWCK